MTQKDLYGIFTPESKTIRDIFDGSNYYRVPDYQRPYSWEDDQIVDLWDDICSAFDAGDAGYFLGPTILIRAYDGYLEVVDGQQRLTTLTILFCVLRDLYLGSDKRILNAIRSLVDERYRLRLITQQNYQNQFEQEILDKVKFPQIRLSKDEKRDRKLLNAALIFREKLEGLATERIEAFADYILDKVIMITIVCSDEAFAVRLFQILNTRGLELSNADLLKSYLYSKLEEDKRGQFISTWNEVEAIASHMHETLESLLTYYEYYVLASNPRRSLYEELQSRFKNQEPNQVIWSFRDFAVALDELLDENPKLINSLRYLPNQVFWKSILATAAVEGFADLSQLAKELRRLYYAYWIAGYTTSKVKQLSFNLIRWIKDGKELGEIKTMIENKMQDDTVPDEVAESLGEDAYGASWLGPLLVLIEYEQTDESKVSFIDLGRDVNVDHVLPQKWESEKYWKGNWSKAQAKQWLHRIGNLTLLSGKKNIRASNSSLPDKKRVYAGKGIDGTTSFIMTQRVTRAQKWTETQVRNRQKWMMNQIATVLGMKF